MINSYSQIYNLGHKELEDLFKDPVLVEEKIDGSQFSFRKIDPNTIEFRSKGREIFLPCKDKLFKVGIDYILSIINNLPTGVIFRGEILSKPKHNSLTYSRVPKHNIIIFDVDFGDQKYSSCRGKVELATILDLETVPVLYDGLIGDIKQLRDFFERESILGGTKIEGFVIKNYNRYGFDKKTLMGKWVSEKFKETHRKEWKNSNPSIGDFIIQMQEIYRHENRWKKAVQHFQEKGSLTNEPKDIGPLMGEVVEDVKKECADEIREKMWKYYWPKIARGLTRGLPQWYKDQLARKQFDKMEEK